MARSDTKTRLRKAEGKLRDATKKLRYAERSVEYWKHVVADLRYEGSLSIQLPLLPLKQEIGILTTSV